jgi:hypothetical protein
MREDVAAEDSRMHMLETPEIWPSVWIIYLAFSVP